MNIPYLNSLWFIEFIPQQDDVTEEWFDDDFGLSKFQAPNAEQNNQNENKDWQEVRKL